MKSIRFFQTIVIVLFLFPAFLHAFEGKVVGISDGDTIKVLKDGKQAKVRLAAIDCPEKKQPYGQKANQFTADRVAVVSTPKTTMLALKGKILQWIKALLPSASVAIANGDTPPMLIGVFGDSVDQILTIGCDLGNSRFVLLDSTK